MQTHITVSKDECPLQFSQVFVHSAIKMLAEREDIDLERALHTVYKMFCNNQAKLIALKGLPNIVVLCCTEYELQTKRP